MGDALRYTFCKSERLTNVKLIENLFKLNESVKAFPIVFIYKFSDTALNIGNQVLFSVPKKKFKRAVDRNKIKRLMRECYRLQKLNFSSAFADKSFYGAFIYTSNELPSYELLYKNFEKIILKRNEKNK